MNYSKMDRSASRLNRPSNDFKKSSPHDNMDYNFTKEQDNETLDSGFDNYDSVLSSGYCSMEQAMSAQFSSMSMSSPPVTTQNTNLSQGHEDFSKTDVTEERYDSGYRSVSIQENSFPEIKLHAPEPAVKEDAVDNEFLQCFIPDKDGDTYLQLAIIQQKNEISFNVIQMCSFPEMLDVANNEGQTALHLSVITNQPQITRCLVAYGANPCCKDRQGNTPLHLACQLGFAAQVEMLTARLDPEEDPGFQKFSLPQNVNERNYLGFTPLHLAVTNNHSRVVDLLINDLHCNVDVNDLRSGRTALHHAIERKNIEITWQILNARPNVDALTYDECSPLHLAAARGLRRETQALIDNGADLYLITRDDCDVFELARHSLRLHNQLREVERKHRERLSSLPHDSVMG